MRITDCHVGQHVWHLGDVEVIITKVCKVQVRITDANNGYYFVNKLIDPCYLYPNECEPRIITQMAQCQVEKSQRIQARNQRTLK